MRGLREPLYDTKSSPIVNINPAFSRQRTRTHPDYEEKESLKPIRLQNTVSEPGGVKSTTLITRDLFGGGGGNSVESESQELDLDLQVPSGWEKCLDLKVNWCSHLGSVCFLRKY